MKKLLSTIRVLYGIRYPYLLVSLMQKSDYRVLSYIYNFWSITDFKTSLKEGQKPHGVGSEYLLRLVQGGILIELGIGFYLIFSNLNHFFFVWLETGLAVIIAYPVVWAHIIILPVAVVKGFSDLIKPRTNKKLAK